MAEQTPRINATMLENFAGKTVRMIGRVTTVRNDEVLIDSQGSVKLQVERQDANIIMGHAVEIVGKVWPDLSVKVFVSTDLGKDLDFSAVEAVVDATHRYKEIFYDGQE